MARWSMDEEEVTMVALPTSTTVRALKAVATRLYSERRMNGDEMRDLAQNIDVLIFAIATDWGTIVCYDES